MGERTSALPFFIIHRGLAFTAVVIVIGILAATRTVSRYQKRGGAGLKKRPAQTGRAVFLSWRMVMKKLLKEHLPIRSSSTGVQVKLGITSKRSQD